MLLARGRQSASGIRWITSLRMNGVNRATTMYGSSRASNAVRNAVTQNPESARTNPIRCSGGHIVSAWAKNSRAPFAVLVWPARKVVHKSRRRSLNHATTG